ncbi:hypothetical protein [Anaerobiospirillum thomasii]|uniref:hypothetical protein n=1 Tax=Anaerobiospirillum thomasii TaxID=179995 RepID=UPI0015EC6D65|nr:hypothetical protein [Anaerobiospirillum thomasii]
MICMIENDCKAQSVPVFGYKLSFILMEYKKTLLITLRVGSRVFFDIFTTFNGLYRA